MEDMFKDFINGDEVKAVKDALKRMHTLTITCIVLVYLVLLDKLALATLTLTLLAGGSLFAAHFIKKWSGEK